MPSGIDRAGALRRVKKAGYWNPTPDPPASRTNLRQVCNLPALTNLGAQPALHAPD